ncbi:MAG: DUF4287 domain-containing protein [Actinomycetes bacterium]
MTDKTGDRSTYWPAIEKKYGQPMSYWFGQMEEIAERKYPEQIAFFKENHGFSQAHANALVMYCRGSKTTKRFVNLKEYLAPFDATKQKTVKAIFKAIKTKYPAMEEVIAWNQPMLKLGDDYIFGVNVLKNHILIAPHDGRQILKDFESRLKDYEVQLKTVRVPVDWKVDTKLLQDLAAARIKATKASAKK